MATPKYVRWFSDLRSEDVALVGGKNASLGELYSALAAEGVRVPNGFALTAQGYRDALDAAGAWAPLAVLLKDLGTTDVLRLAENAASARAIVYGATGTDELREQMNKAYRQLEAEYGDGVSVAVRSSATAEDLPTASFAGQHESFLNVSGPEDLFEACRRCFASVFTDRAIVYRNDLELAIDRNSPKGRRLTRPQDIRPIQPIHNSPPWERLSVQPSSVPWPSRARRANQQHSTSATAPKPATQASGRSM